MIRKGGEAGTQEDLAQAGFRLSPQQQNLKPFLVHYTVTAMANGKLDGARLISMYGIDDRQEQHIMSVANSNFSGARLNQCRTSAFKSGDSAGSSFSDCQLYMIDQHDAIVSAAFKGNGDKEADVPFYFNNPIVWTAGEAPAQSPPDGQGTIDTH